MSKHLTLQLTYKATLESKLFIYFTIRSLAIFKINKRNHDI